jgi:hypothetical protein
MELNSYKSRYKAFVSVYCLIFGFDEMQLKHCLSNDILNRKGKMFTVATS